MSINWLHRKPYTQQFRFEVFEAYIGLSVIDFFAQRFAFKSRDYWLRLIEEGKITVNRQGVDPNQILKANDLIHTVRDDVQEPPVNPDYKIIYDQDGVLVINKPAPLPVHPAGRFNKNTLLYLLREQHPDRKFHTIHRLDAHTSGVLIMATESQRARFLHLQMEKNQMQKVYGVIAKGDFGTETFVVDLPVGRVCRVKRGYGAGLEDGKDAKTEFTPLHKNGEWTFLLAKLHTGRTNQIRVHIQAKGGEVMNDPLYAENPVDDQTHQMGLHCWQMTCAISPQDERTFTAPWPEHFLEMFSEALKGLS